MRRFRTFPLSLREREGSTQLGHRPYVGEGPVSDRERTKTPIVRLGRSASDRKLLSKEYWKLILPPSGQWLTLSVNMTGTKLKTKVRTPPETRRLGYARVSTYGQTLDAQLEQLRAERCVRIYGEKVKWRAARPA